VKRTSTARTTRRLLARGWRSARLALAGALALGLAGNAPAQDSAAPSNPAAFQSFDRIIAGGTVYDGSGAGGQVMDVGIRGDRITALGDLSTAPTKDVIDASGLAVVPGFIDIHSHAVNADRETSGLFNHPQAENYLRQGVTTAIGGPDGRSWYPVAALLEAVGETPIGINFGTFVGHNTVRAEVMGRERRAPTADELDAMANLVDTAMREGAWGLSAGLKYIPGAYAETGEVIALARAAAAHDGIYIVHLRDEGRGLLDSVRETLTIGEAAGIPVQVTHHKAMGVSMWGRSVDSLALLDEANARGIDASSDQYPYTASSTGLSVLFPAWSLAGDRAERLERMADPAQRPRIRAGIVESLRIDRAGDDLTRVALANCRWDPTLNGLNLEQVLQRFNEPVTLEAAAERVLWLEAQGGCSAVYHTMSAEDVDRIMRHPRTMIASDGGIYQPGADVPHPRNYGSFARVLGVYVRERGVLDFPTAIHKMSRMPADRMGMSDRGRLAVGAYADVAVLDPDRVIDRATFENPHQMSEGVVHVLVNGQVALRDGALTETRAGRVLKLTDRN
jgi:dihydroorotase/N-acyl-D-amino-acid deacylase